MKKFWKKRRNEEVLQKYDKVLQEMTDMSPKSRLFRKELRSKYEYAWQLTKKLGHDYPYRRILNELYKNKLALGGF